MTILTERRIWVRESIQRTGGVTLTRDQQANVRRAVTYLRARFRSAKTLAKAIGMTPDALRKASSPRRQQTLRLAVALAYVAGVKVEMITSGQWPKRGSCPYCGRD